VVLTLDAGHRRPDHFAFFYDNTRFTTMRARISFGVFLTAFGTLFLPVPDPRQPAPAEEGWLKAPALRPGDTIRFVAPAGPPDKDRVLKCVHLLEQKGFKVDLPKNLFRKNGYLAGTDEERATELNAAIRDPNIAAVFPCRGGYGLTRILDKIDYAALRKHPKIVIGFSDLTALHLAVAAKAKVITFHSPMPEAALWRDDGDFAFAHDSLWRALRADKYPGGKGQGYVVAPPKGGPQPQRLVGGKATGRLVGGNLSLICATLGTPYGLRAKGNILFLEDTGEAPYRVDRFFSQLRLAGILDEVAGLVIGSFDKTDVQQVDKVVREYCSGLKCPVVLNFPVGHTMFNATLPHGALAELDADLVQLRLLEDPVLLK
jgi:muramoyltetrapeptide carboxypeptidase